MISSSSLFLANRLTLTSNMWILSQTRKTAYRADCLIFFLLIAMYTWRWIFYTPWKNDDDACCPHIAGEYYINFTISINVLCLTPARRALVTYLKRSMLRSVQLCEYFPSWQRILYVQQITLSQAHGYISTNAIKACFDSSLELAFSFISNANFFALSFRYDDDRFSRVFHLIDTPRYNFLRTTPDGSGFDANLPISSAN